LIHKTSAGYHCKRMWKSLIRFWLEQFFSQGDQSCPESFGGKLIFLKEKGIERRSDAWGDDE